MKNIHSQSKEFLPFITNTPHRFLVYYNRKEYYLVEAIVEHKESPSLRKTITMTLRLTSELENDNSILHDILFHKLQGTIVAYVIREHTTDQVTHHAKGKEVVSQHHVSLHRHSVETLAVEDFNPGKPIMTFKITV